MVHRSKRNKGIALAGIVGLGCEESRKEVGGIRDEVLGSVEDGLDRENRVLADIGMPVLQTPS